MIDEEFDLLFFGFEEGYVVVFVLDDYYFVFLVCKMVF